MTNEEYQRNVEKLSEQIANQRKNLGTDRYYRGDIGALGGIDAATRSMAETLARSGITNLADIGEKQEKAYGIDFSVDPEKAINDFAKWYQSGGWQGQSAQTRVNIDGKDYWYTNLVVGSSGGEDQGVITQPALLPFGHVGEPQKILYNKKTGEQLKQGGDAGYAYAHTGVNLDESGKPVADNYTFGGSFAGDNTSFNLKMVDGVPVFYSTPGVSSSFFDAQDLAKGIGLMSLMLPGIGTALGGAITGALGIGANAFTNAALGNVLLSTVASGGDVDLEKALTSVAMGAAAQGISSGITPEIASAVGNLGLEPDIEKLVTNVASKSATAGTMAALTGRDVETAMQNAALNAGIGSLMSPAGPTQEDIDAIMNLGGTPEQIALTQDIEAFANLGGTPEQQAAYEQDLNEQFRIAQEEQQLIDAEIARQLAADQTRIADEERQLYENEQARLLREEQDRIAAEEQQLIENESARQEADTVGQIAQEERDLIESDRARQETQDIESLMNLGGTPEQQRDTALLEGGAGGAGGAKPTGGAPTGTQGGTAPGSAVQSQQLDPLSFLGLLGLMGGQQQRPPPPQYQVAKEVPVVPFEQMFTPYSAQRSTTNEDLLKFLRG